MQEIQVQSLGGAKIQHGLWTKKKKTQHYNKLSKDFKNGSHQKEKKMFLKGTHIEARMAMGHLAYESQSL